MKYLYKVKVTLIRLRPIGPTWAQYKRQQPKKISSQSDVDTMRHPLRQDQSQSRLAGITVMR